MEARGFIHVSFTEAISRLKEYNTILVWVLEKNERAIRFYHRYGFEFDGCKKEWNLGTPVSIVRMIKKCLKPALWNEPLADRRATQMKTHAIRDRDLHTKNC